MKTVLVTGPIGGGKSRVCGFLAQMGYPVYDCDSRCKALYEEVPHLKERIEETIGVPFSQIGIIFRDEQKREALEALVYPILLEDFLSWRGAQSSGIVFVESAVALSKGVFDGVYDSVLMVVCPLEVREKRNPKALERDSLQEFDLSRADYIIRNDSTLEALEAQVEAAVAFLNQ